MHDLGHYNLGDMAVCTGAIRRLGSTAQSFEQVAQGVVDYFYDNLLQGQDGKKACALVRFFRTRDYGSLPADLKATASSTFQADLCFPTMKCLLLEASRGEKSEWNQITASAGHRAIPLPSEALVRQMPMICKLIEDFGLPVSDLLEPPEQILIGQSEEDYNIFHVPEALGSSYIPAQEQFVKPHGIRSVLGFGGTMGSGNIFAVILFSKVKISRDVADMFRCIALATNLAVMRFDERPPVAKKPSRDRSKLNKNIPVGTIA